MIIGALSDAPDRIPDVEVRIRNWQVWNMS